jgi:phage internal scaffolding protein
VSKATRKFSTYYDHHKAEGLTTTEPTRTQKQFKEECDINHILDKYQQQELVPTSDRQPLFGDFTDERITDYHLAMQTITGVGELMQQLPAKVRDRFKNNPAAILDFIADPNNHQEARDLGLMNPLPEPARVVPTEPEKK